MKKTFEIPTIYQSLYLDYKNKRINIEEVANEIFKANLSSFLDISFAERKMKEQETKTI